MGLGLGQLLCLLTFTVLNGGGGARRFCTEDFEQDGLARRRLSKTVLNGGGARRFCTEEGKQDGFEWRRWSKAVVHGGV